MPDLYNDDALSRTLHREHVFYEAVCRQVSLASAFVRCVAVVVTPKWISVCCIGGLLLHCKLDRGSATGRQKAVKFIRPLFRRGFCWSRAGNLREGGMFRCTVVGQCVIARNLKRNGTKQSMEHEDGRQLCG